MKYEDSLSLRNYRICCRHFTSDKYINLETRKLRSDAFPTLHPTIAVSNTAQKNTGINKCNIVYLLYIKIYYSRYIT